MEDFHLRLIILELGWNSIRHKIKIYWTLLLCKREYILGLDVGCDPWTSHAGGVGGQFLYMLGSQLHHQ